MVIAVSPSVCITSLVACLLAWYLTREDPMSLATVRARHAAKSLSGKVAVVVGGTAGIGAGIALRLARADASVIIVGRSKQRGDEMVARMSTLSKTASHSFVPCNAMLLSQVTEFAAKFSQSNTRLDYLVLTQGMATVQGRTETVEGLDEKMSLHYYSRVAFIEKLAPLMTGDDSRVLSVLSAGVHSPYQNYSQDPGLKQSYSLANAANAAGFYNDLAMESLALEHPTVSFIHAAPGTVNTNWGTELPVVLRWLVRAIQPLFRSIEDAGEYLSCALLDDDYRGGWKLMGPNGQHVQPTAKQGEAREKVWEHTQEVLQALLK